MSKLFEIGDHIFFPLSPAQNYGVVRLTGFGDEVYTECVIERWLDFKEEYKVLIQPLDGDRFCSRSVYSEDLEEHIKREIAVIKRNKNDHVEVWEGIEPIEGSCAYIVHSGTCVVMG